LSGKGTSPSRRSIGLHSSGWLWYCNWRVCHCIHIEIGERYRAILTPCHVVHGLFLISFVVNEVNGALASSTIITP
jgi:hypothetical protein